MKTKTTWKPYLIKIMDYYRKISFEEAQELPDLTPEEEQEALERHEWEDYLASIPTAAERNR